LTRRLIYHPHVHTHRRIWWLQSALIGADVTKGVGPELVRVLGIGAHELEDPEALCLEAPPHVRCGFFRGGIFICMLVCIIMMNLDTQLFITPNPTPH
jgi:hypothetical protein